MIRNIYNAILSILGATIWESVTPSDSATLDHNVAAIYVGEPGDLVVEDATGNEETFKNVVAGAIYEIKPTKIKAATTAGSLLILKNK